VPFGLSMSLGLTVNALDLPLTAKEGNSGDFLCAASLHCQLSSVHLPVFMLHLIAVLPLLLMTLRYLGCAFC